MAIACTKISLSEGFSALVVEGPDIRVEFKDGRVIVHSGEVQLPNAKAKLVATASAAACKAGDMMPEGHRHAGWIYCEADGKPLYVAPKDSGVMKWQEAMDYAARDGSELPTAAELNAIYRARNEGAFKDTFNTTGSYPAGWYWSSSQDNSYHAWMQRFSDGYRNNNGNKDFAASLRCVRR